MINRARAAAIGVAVTASLSWVVVLAAGCASSPNANDVDAGGEGTPHATLDGSATPDGSASIDATSNADVASTTPEAAAGNDSGSSSQRDGSTDDAQPALDGGVEACLGKSLLDYLGSDTLLVGGMMKEETGALAPFDIRYEYLAGGIFDGPAPCASCMDADCSANGTACSTGCIWWGCWEDVSPPPGKWALKFYDSCATETWAGAARPQIPWISYYEHFQSAGTAETTQFTKDPDPSFVGRYLSDFRFALQKIGTRKAMMHIEPDYWGFAEELNSSPHAIPVAVTLGNPTDCGSFENSVSGLAKCMIHMTRVYAPNTKVGLQASAWATFVNPFTNSVPMLNDPVGLAAKVAAYMADLGAKDGDFIVVDPSNGDAGYYDTQGKNTWWDDTNQTIPNFHVAFQWTKALAEDLQLPAVHWQVPVGNMRLDDTKDHYRDNRLDYYFAHTDEIVQSHTVAILFGTGLGTTTPETDGNNFVNQTTKYRASGGRKFCP